MKYFRISIILLIILVAYGISSADIYEWVDENGVTHYSDGPVRDNEPAEKTVSSEETRPAADQTEKRAGAPDPSIQTKERNELMESISKLLEEPEPEKKETGAAVELYVTDWCPWCKKAEAFLDSEGVDYVIYNVQRDRKAAARMKSLTDYNGVPFAVIGRHHIRGYSENAYRRALRSR